MRNILYIALMLGCASCTEINQDEKVLAQVYQVKLLEKDLTNHIPKRLVKSDSMQWVSEYIKRWVREQILLHEAEKVLTEAQKNKEKQLADYKKELIIYELEKSFVANYQDSGVSMAEIRNYYNTHRKEFELRKNITRLHYIKLRKDAPAIDKVKFWFNSDDTSNIKKIESYCALYAENYFFNDKVWLSFDDILKEIPLRNYNEEEFLQNNKKTILEDNNHIYMIEIVDFRIKNDVSPIEFEIDNIRNILSNKKKLQVVEEAELKIQRAAEANGYIKINKK
ncbi:MAG: hypothetical protein HYZ42_04570 [Bacteroidetes bacterium]|nr:hypothetical protein [Bacteroidota bacterium]